MDWPTLASELGLPLARRALPARVPCPLCEQPDLHVIESTTPSLTANCRNCGFAGGPAELAASVWHCTAAEAAARLGRRAGREAPPDLARIWRRARQSMAGAMPENVRNLRLHFGLFDPGDHSRPVGTELGWAPRKVIAAATGVKLLGAKEQLVLPFWSSPDNLSGLYVVGGPRRRRFLSLSAEAGLHGLASAKATPHFDGTIVSCRDALLLARLNAVQARYTQRQLPMVARHWGVRAKTTAAWQTLGCGDLVHWSRELDWELLATVITAGGRVLLSGPEDDSWRSWMRFTCDHQPLEWLRRQLERAETWQKTLYRWLRRAGLPETAELAASLRSAGVSPSIILDVMVGVPRRLWRAACRYVEQSEALCTFDPPGCNYRVRQTPDGWFGTAAPYHAQTWVVLNARLSVEYLVTDGGRAWYRGRLYQGGKEYPFEAPPEQVEGNTWQWLRVFAAVHGLDVTIDHRLRDRLFEIARAFRTPQTVRAGALPPFSPAPLLGKKYRPPKRPAA